MASPVQSKSALPRLRRSESLANILAQGGPLPEEQIWGLLDQLLRYLEDLHQKGRCHRSFSLYTIGFDDAGDLEIAGSDGALTVSDLLRLHVPLPSALRHEFALAVPPAMHDATVALSHAGFDGNGESLDLFEVASLLIRLLFDVNGEKFLASPCLQETLPPPLAHALCAILAADRQVHMTAGALRRLLPGVEIALPPSGEGAKCSDRAFESPVEVVESVAEAPETPQLAAVEAACEPSPMAAALTTEQPVESEAEPANAVASPMSESSEARQGWRPLAVGLSILALLGFVTVIAVAALTR